MHKLQTHVTVVMKILPMSEKFYPCTILGCCKDYSNLRNLKQHLKIVHGQGDVVKAGRFSCTECGQSFYHAAKLVQHCDNQHGKELNITRDCCYVRT